MIFSSYLQVWTPDHGLCCLVKVCLAYIQTARPWLSDGHRPFPVDMHGLFPFPWTAEGTLWVCYSWDKRAGAVKALRALRGLNGPHQPHMGPPHTPTPGAVLQLSRAPTCRAAVQPRGSAAYLPMDSSRPQPLSWSPCLTLALLWHLVPWDGSYPASCAIPVPQGAAGPHAPR